MSLNAITDAASAVQRLSAVFEAELLDETRITEHDLPNAIEVLDASFTWDSPPPETPDKKQRKRHSKEVRRSQHIVAEKSKPEEDRIFNMEDISLAIPRAQLIAIVGPVGSGKTSLLQGIIGEMRRTAGSVRFGGSVAYCPQVAWIQVRKPYHWSIISSRQL
jgi:ABC-type transport system involved in cytochrome bd biosynthesis fused ATPase/permease subunit